MLSSPRPPGMVTTVPAASKGSVPGPPDERGFLALPSSPTPGPRAAPAGRPLTPKQSSGPLVLVVLLALKARPLWQSHRGETESDSFLPPCPGAAQGWPPPRPAPSGGPQLRSCPTEKALNKRLLNLILASEAASLPPTVRTEQGSALCTPRLRHRNEGDPLPLDTRLRESCKNQESAREGQSSGSLVTG